MDILDLVLAWHATTGLSPDVVERPPAYIHREQASVAYIHREQASVAER